VVGSRGRVEIGIVANGLVESFVEICVVRRDAVESMSDLSRKATSILLALYREGTNERPATAHGDSAAT